MDMSHERSNASVDEETPGRARRRSTTSFDDDGRPRTEEGDARRARMFGSFGALFASGPKLAYDVDRSFDARAFGVWKHARGRSKETGDAVSVFTFTGDAQKDAQRLALARNGAKRLKTLRHPNVLLTVDVVEIESGSEVTIHIITEAVTPLETHLLEFPHGAQQREEYLTLGLKEVATAVAFLSNDCRLVHGGVSMAAVVVTDRLDWKLHGFDLCSELDAIGQGVNGDAKLIRGAFLVPDQYKPEEFRRGDWVSIPEGPSWAIDAWGLGCLIQEVFRGEALRGTDQLREIDCIPQALLKDYQRLLGSQAARRYNPKKLIENSAWSANKLVETITFISTLALKDSIEKERFFGHLPRVLETLAKPPVEKKIMPMLCDALKFNQAPHQAILPMLIAAQDVPKEKYQKLVIPTILKLYESPDKMIRLDLLENLSRYADHVRNDQVDDPLYERMSTGFTSQDSNVREMTLKGVLQIVPRLSERVLGASLLKHLSKLQIDEDPAIRANTTICLGNIARYLNETTAKRVLLNAFTRALKDAFPPARLAGLMALEHTTQYYEPGEVSGRLLPALAPLMTDGQKDVRERAFTVADLYIESLKRHSAALERGADAAAAHVEAEQKRGHANAAKRAAGMLSWAVTMAANKIGGPDTDHAPVDLQSEKLQAKSFSSSAPPPKLYGESPRTSTQSTPATSLAPSPAKPLTDAYDANRRNLQAAAEQVSSLALNVDDDLDGWGDLDIVDPAEEAARTRLNSRVGTSRAASIPKSSSATSHESDGWGNDNDETFEDMSVPASRPNLSSQQMGGAPRVGNVPGARAGASAGAGANGHVGIGGVRRPPSSGSIGGVKPAVKPPPMKLGAKSALSKSNDIDLEEMLK